MVSEKAGIRKFVFKELHNCSDLSTLTLGILRRRYLDHVGRESLSVEHKQWLKRIVEEELLKMQDNGSDKSLVMSAQPSKKQNKRKREEELDKGESDGQSEDDVVAIQKKSRFESVLPDSPDSGIEKAAHEEPLKDDDEERDGHEEETKKKAQHTARGKSKGRLSSESAEEKKSRRSRKVIDSEEEEEEEALDSFDEEEEQQQKAKSRGQGSEGHKTSEQAGKARAPKSRREESIKESKSPESEAVRRVQKEVFGSSSESEEDGEGTKAKGKEGDDGESDDGETSKKKDSVKASSDEELGGKGDARDEDKDSQSDSSSLPSLEEEDEEEQGKKKEEKKSGSKKKNSDDSEGRGRKVDENKAVSRFKRYIALCGARRNYKKLLAGCRSVKAKVAVLKKELEELGVEGQPSIEKCKKARLKREEAQELAELDVSNIITTQGRPKRRAAAAWPLPGGKSSSTPAFKRAVNSDSDGENGSTDRGCKRTTDWSNLKGIISDDADSD